jgi:hypothetical protein
MRNPERFLAGKSIDLLDAHRGKHEQPCKSNPTQRPMTAAEWEDKLSAEGLPSRLPTLERKLRRTDAAGDVENLSIEPDAAAPEDPRLRALYDLYHRVRNDFTAIEHAVFWTRVYGGESLTRVARKFKLTPSAISHATSRILAKLNAARSV